MSPSSLSGGLDLVEGSPLFSDICCWDCNFFAICPAEPGLLGRLMTVLTNPFGLWPVSEDTDTEWVTEAAGDSRSEYWEAERAEGEAGVVPLLGGLARTDIANFCMLLVGSWATTDTFLPSRFRCYHCLVEVSFFFGSQLIMDIVPTRNKPSLLLLCLFRWGII